MRLNQKGAIDTLLVLGTIVVLLVGGGVLYALTSDSNAPSIGTEQQDADEKTDDETAGQDPETKTIEGVLNEVFEDCASYRVFENGEVVEKDQISCDGGSFVVINDVKVQTSAGYVPADQYYIKDISGLAPGDTVQAIYVEEEFGNTLNCDTCDIIKISN